MEILDWCPEKGEGGIEARVISREPGEEAEALKEVPHQSPRGLLITSQEHPSISLPQFPFALSA